MRGDEQGVSEVIGYLLVFGILSIVLVMSMSAFAVGSEAAKERALVLHAESAAARVAGVVVQTAVLWEQQEGDVAVAYLVDLPEQLEGVDYAVYLDEQCTAAATCADPPGCTAAGGGSCCLPPATCTYPDRVRVMIPAYDIQVAAPVFAAAAPLDLSICSGAVGYTSATGGPLYVRISAPFGEAMPSCGDNTLFLEAS